MDTLDHMFANNRTWAASMEAMHPGFFATLARQQAPKYLWIGCADSRVPANEIVGLLPGELFVHRNVANLVIPTDFNCLAVLQYAVDVLKVEHIIVCGHYGCGGISAAMDNRALGLIDNWLRHVQDIHLKHSTIIDVLSEPCAAENRLCELNVIEQVWHVCQSTVVSAAWRRGQALSVHGIIYRVDDGLLRDFGLCVAGEDEIAQAYRAALRSVPRVP
jgi:carbonic anhydrase